MKIFIFFLSLSGWAFVHAFKPNVNLELINQCKEKSGNPNFEYYLWGKEYDTFNRGFGGLYDGGLSRNLRRFWLSNDTSTITTDAQEIKPVLNKFIEYYVAYVNEFLVCFDNDDDSAISIRETKSKLDGLLNLVFDNNAQSAIDFKTNGGVECIDNSGFSRCGSIISRIGLNMKLPTFKSDSLTSSEFQNLRTCIKDAIKACNSEVLNNLVIQADNLISDDLLITYSSVLEYNPEYGILTEEVIQFSKEYYINKIIFCGNLKFYFESQKERNEPLLKEINSRIKSLKSTIIRDDRTT